MASSISGIATHLLAIGAGIAVGLAWPSGNPRQPEDKTAAATGTKRRADVPALDTTALLGTLQKEINASREEDPDGDNAGKRLFSLYGELRQTLEPAADPKDAFLKLLADTQKAGGFDDEMLKTEEGMRKLAMLGVRYAQWFDLDPHAALAGHDPENEVMRWVNSHFIARIATDRVDRDGLRNSIGWLNEVEPAFMAWRIVSMDLGKSGSVEDLRWLLEDPARLPSDRWNSYGMSVLGENWPLEKRDELVEALTGSARVKAMIEIASRMEGKSGMEWVRGWIESDSLDEEARKAVAVEDIARRLSQSKDFSISDKVDLAREFGHLRGDPKQFTNQLVAQSIGGFFEDSEQDWFYSFRHGLTTADEVLKAALAGCPDPGSSRGEFESQVFRHLAEDDLDAAMGLLSGMTPRDQDWQKVYAARWWFEGVDPEDFVALISSISLDDDPAARDSLQQAWRDKSQPNLERYGEDYLDWLKTLPAGNQRNWALQGLQAASKDRYPWIHAEVSNLLEGKR